LESALWHFEHAETALHDAWNALRFLGDKDPIENKAFELYDEASAFAARIRDSKSVVELRKRIHKKGTASK